MTMLADLVTTDITGLDTLLGGGLTPTSLTFVIGPPGAGKTVLSSQILFAAARAGIPSVILTAFSEGHEKLIQHLRGFAFFDQALLGTRIQLLTAQGVIGQEKTAIPTTLVRLLKDTGARIVLLDGFQGLQAFAEDPQASRSFLALLATQLLYAGVTTLLTVAGDARNPELSAAMTAADTVIGLTYTADEMRHTRMIEVVKQRGRPQLPGRHSYRIDSSGIVVRPRLESYPTPVSQQSYGKYALFGLPELDGLLGGGIPVGTTSVLAGAPGTGKTTLALRWAVQDATHEQPTVWMTFQETPEQLATKGDAFGIPVAAAIASGALRIIRISPVDINPDEFAFLLLETVNNSLTQRVVIDDIAFLLRALKDRVRDYCAALVEQLSGRGVSSLSMLEIDPFGGFRLNLANLPIAVLSENLIVIQQHLEGNTIRRLLAVLRMRFSDHDRTLRELVLHPQGIRVLSTPLHPSEVPASAE